MKLFTFEENRPNKREIVTARPSDRNIEAKNGLLTTPGLYISGSRIQISKLSIEKIEVLLSLMHRG